MKVEDTKKLAVLSVFHYLLGTYYIITGLFMLPFLLVGIGGFLDYTNNPTGNGPGPYSLTSWGEVFITLFICLAYWLIPIALFLVAGKLRKYKSRKFCLVVGSFECILFPFGTILGISTLVLLNRVEIKQIFEEKAVEPLTTDVTDFIAE